MSYQTTLTPRIVFFVAAVVSGVASTIGIYHTLAASEGAMWMALLLGFATCILIFFSWDFFASRMVSARGSVLLAGFAVLPVVLGMIFFLSSWYNAAAIVGPDASRRHVHEFVRAYEKAVTDAQRVAQSLTALRYLTVEKDSGATRLPRFESLTRAEAAMTYMENYPIQWATAVAIDAFPALILLLMLVFRPSASSNPLNDVTVGELRQAAKAFGEIDSARQDVNRPASPKLRAVED